MICPTCGKRNPPGAAACSRCGRWLATNRMMGVTYHRSDLRRGSGPGAVAIGAALIAGLLFVGGAIYVSLLGGLQGNNGPGTSPLGAIDTPISSLPIFIQPTPTPTPSPTPTPTLPWYLTPSPSFSFGLSSPTPGIPAPTANFRGAIQSDGRTVVWTDKSTGDITSWLWNFGDGNGSTQQSPTYTYQSLGDYTVTLTVSGPGGSDTQTKVLHLIPAPTADFTCSVSYLKVSCQVGTTTGQIASFAWDWGDGSTSVGANKKHPSHTYTEGNKQYTITLTVSNSGGSSSNTQTVTTVQPTPPPSPTPTPAPTGTAAPVPSAPVIPSASASIAYTIGWDSRITFVVG